MARRRTPPPEPQPETEEVAGADEVALVGEVVEQPVPLVPVPAVTPEVSAHLRSRAISRTDQQVLSGTVFVTLLVWILRLNGVDLNPLPDQVDIPAEVGAALGAVFTVTFCRWMNRTPKDGG